MKISPIIQDAMNDVFIETIKKNDIVMCIEALRMGVTNLEMGLSIAIEDKNSPPIFAMDLFEYLYKQNTSIRYDFFEEMARAAGKPKLGDVIQSFGRKYEAKKNRFSIDDLISIDEDRKYNDDMEKIVSRMNDHYMNLDFDDMLVKEYLSNLENNISAQMVVNLACVFDDTELLEYCLEHFYSNIIYLQGIKLAASFYSLSVLTRLSDFGYFEDKWRVEECIELCSSVMRVLKLEKQKATLAFLNNQLPS